MNNKKLKQCASCAKWRLCTVCEYCGGDICGTCLKKDDCPLKKGGWLYRAIKYTEFS